MRLQTKKTKTRIGGDPNPKGKMAKTPTNPKNAGVAEPFTTAQRKIYVWRSAIEVVADDFIVIGYGSTVEEPTIDHDKILMAFLERCKEQGVKLNTDKLNLRMMEVLFIGHIAMDKGLHVDPAKVRAIRDIPAPTDKAGRRLLGLMQYLGKFLPQLSDITKPMRELKQNNVQWAWGTDQETSLEALKKAVMSTPVLCYYNLQEEVALQCDTSQFGLGAALLQNGQPVAYASRAFTDTETRCAQIEKELLAIVFGCERFEPYVYSRDLIEVESDLKPLEAIFCKPLHPAPKRLQRMLLRLQKYTLRVTYRKGQDMFLADTLSEHSSWRLTPVSSPKNWKKWITEPLYQSVKNAGNR